LASQHAVVDARVAATSPSLVSALACSAAAPWWAWIGGALGAYYVVVVIIFAQKLGAGTLVAIFVCAQLITSVVLDLTGRLLITWSMQPSDAIAWK
jgi:uncharacterized membrane protein YdcZ (DUF606 family)